MWYIFYWVYDIANVEALFNSIPNGARPDSNVNANCCNAERLCNLGNVNVTILCRMSASKNLAWHTFKFALVDCECYSARRWICCSDLSSHSFIALLYVHVEVIRTFLIVFIFDCECSNTGPLMLLLSLYNVCCHLLVIVSSRCYILS